LPYPFPPSPFLPLPAAAELEKGGEEKRKEVPNSVCLFFFVLSTEIGEEGERGRRRRGLLAFSFCWDAGRDGGKERQDGGLKPLLPLFLPSSSAGGN